MDEDYETSENWSDDEWDDAFGMEITNDHYGVDSCQRCAKTTNVVANLCNDCYGKIVYTSSEVCECDNN